jgi:hypothetical protein
MCGNETELVIRLLIFDDKDSALLNLLDDSDATLDPGLIYIPDIINKIHNTKTRYLHIYILQNCQSQKSSQILDATKST